MNKTEDDKVVERLRSPPTRDKMTVARLVARYRSDIEKARRSGKTWAMIGQDLQPDHPIKADTVRRSVERVRRGRARNARTVQQPTVISPPAPLAAESQLELQAPPTSKNPFARKVDPIRNEN